MLPPKRTNEQRAMELLALFVEEIQKNNEFDQTLLHAVKEFLKDNCISFYDEDDDDKDDKNDEDNDDKDDDEKNEYICDESFDEKCIEQLNLNI